MIAPEIGSTLTSLFVFPEADIQIELPSDVMP